jgi:hypothetical protein
MVCERSQSDRGVRVVLGFERGMNRIAMEGIKIYHSEVWVKRERFLVEREPRGGQV